MNGDAAVDAKFPSKWRLLAGPVERAWRRWLLGRRSLGTPTALTADVVSAAQASTLEEAVRVAGTRWTIESSFEAAKSEVELDHDALRSWTG